MRSDSLPIAGLTCRVIDWLADDVPPRLVVVLCHGFGAPGTDLVPLADELVRREPRLAKSVRFVFPAAPLDLSAGGLPASRAWWMLDVEELMAAVESGQTRILRDRVPPGLAEASHALTGAVQELSRDTGVPLSLFVLGGFSQGAMVSLDVALRLPEKPAGVALFSGTLLAESEWRPLAFARGGLTVVLSHGRQDQILPFFGAEWLRDLLIEAGWEVDFVPFDGFHSIPPTAVERFASLLERLISTLDS
ncbi:MAG: phospholipase [Planctomycetes bacterium]|nr:phospholipase [Planctomycetota bacterium]